MAAGAPAPMAGGQRTGWSNRRPEGRAGKDRPKYGEDLEHLIDFVLTAGRGKYRRQVQAIVDRSRSLFTLDLEDLVDWKSAPDLVTRVESCPTAYIQLIADAVDYVIETPRPGAEIKSSREKPPPNDIFDFLRSKADASIQEGEAGTDPAERYRALRGKVGTQLLRRFDVSLKPREAAQTVPLREMRSDRVGKLTKISGMVISISPVHPRAQVVTYVCEQCGEARYQEVVSDKFAPLHMCDSLACRTNYQRGRLIMQMRACKFANHQELRLQELQKDVPQGSVPRTMKVVCEDTAAGAAVAGGVVDLVGVMVPDTSASRATGAFRQSVTTPMHFRALSVAPQKRAYDDAERDEEVAEKVDEVRQLLDADKRVDKLVSSIAPEIFGMEDVKTVLLCQLIGGVELDRPDGLRLRGDLNVCLMGDPGVAKSQLLRWIAALSPRSVFTTGKGSSGVGLTVSVKQDEHTRETVLEAGALVLSDKGICCIDEFDKMDEHDRTAIHEVMEQQTVSIAKGGIVTSLNARTSILAAANPQYGRWKSSRSCAENINLPPSLLSRFDILWLLLDKGDRDQDALLAEHVLSVHQNNAPKGCASREEMFGIEADKPYFPKDFLHGYIAEAKKIKAFLDESAVQVVQDFYCHMRQDESMKGEDATTYTTPRNLMSILRMAQALARLRLESVVNSSHVQRAVELMKASKQSIIVSQDLGGMNRRSADPVERIYLFLKEKTVPAIRPDNNRIVVQLESYLANLRHQGYRHSDIAACFERYETADVWKVQRDPSGERFTSLTWL